MSDDLRPGPGITPEDAMPPTSDLHRHECAAWQRSGRCSPPCRCACGAVLAPGPTYDRDGRWVWMKPDGTFDPFPDRRA
jgi:hypothetical protein